MKSYNSVRNGCGSPKGAEALLVAIRSKCNLKRYN